jgi:putative photosynthetic complex assembly protein 2
MVRHGWPILFAILLWWSATGAILWLDRFRARSRGRVMIGATAMLALALVGLSVSSHDESALGVYLAFVSALAVWGWNEIAFLSGFLAGSSRTPCPVGSTGWNRFGRGLGAVAHHETALLLSGFAVAALCAGGPNRTGLVVFAILWVMRVSAKLNLFLGVPNAPHDMLPAHLAHLGSFFRRRAMNLLFPVSVTAATVLCLLLSQEALRADIPDAAAASATLLAALAALGVIEHWFLVFPWRAETLWGWGLSSPPTAPPAESTSLHREPHDDAAFEVSIPPTTCGVSLSTVGRQGAAS